MTVVKANTGQQSTKSSSVMHFTVLIPRQKLLLRAHVLSHSIHIILKQENAFFSKHQNYVSGHNPFQVFHSRCILHAASSRTKHALSGQRGLSAKSAKPDHSATRALLVILELSKGSTMLTARASPQILVPLRLFSAALAESALLNLITAKRGSRCN